MEYSNSTVYKELKNERKYFNFIKNFKTRMQNLKIPHGYKWIFNKSRRNYWNEWSYRGEYDGLH